MKINRRGALLGAAGAAGAAAVLPGAAQAAPAAPPTANGRLHEIGAGRHRVLVGGVAATVLSWTVDGREMLLTHDPEDVGEGYQGKTILPWANRIDHGAYTFEGEELQVAINEPERDAALHGLMSFVEWSPVSHRADSVVLEHVLPPDYGYPFRLAFRIEFRVDDRGFSSTLSATNVGRGPAPFGTANHTYLAAAPGTRIDDIELEIPADTYYVVNDRLIPTGTAPVEGTEYDFRSARPIGRTTMDTAFTGLHHEGGEAVVRFRRPDVDVELWVDESHHYLQVYTDDDPSTDRPGRQGLTVEPMTLAPNAFVTGDGLIVLQPGRTRTGTWGYRLAE
ncbi:aldose 1-epimerase family protein [Saccharopolyspora sp. TS4A08]|uniref:Aldose 1-epimerase family protein n=1 Tax=Saccharopolyspora ipomoeae TaxID=3042027 RepID=A0ABT6PW52_9PSEU|nr:aldose 1-epimerase family protein [Saccharopolyspora sp. TS4A08]MDI2032239.1 aldose 1-epimerase family protein [Saccharopolyspora sp. TS4A08]